MRTPSSRKPLYQWWARQVVAIEGFRTVRQAQDAGIKTVPTPDEPQCGFYACRMQRGGALVEARIFLEQPLDRNGELAGDEVLRLQVGDDFYIDIIDRWPWLANRPISQAAYRHMAAHRKWKRSRPAIRVADPDIVIDFLTAPPPMIAKSKGKRSNRDKKRRSA